MIEDILNSSPKPSFDAMPEMVFNLEKRCARIEQILLSQNSARPISISEELTIEQAGVHLHLKSRHSVTKLINSGKLSGYKLSGRWRILASEIERYKEEHRK